jgi:hypothetical protein
MKFDTPATTNPIDQLKVVGKPTDRIDGRSRRRAPRPTPMSGTMSCESGLWLCRRIGDRQGADRVDRI